MKAVIPLLLVLLLVPITKVTAQGTDPLSLVEAVDAALNSGDVAKTTAFYADDAVFTNSRGRKISGKEAIRAVIQANVNARIHVELVNPHVVGDAVTVTIWESNDSYVRLGVAPVEIESRVVVQGGKIKSRTLYYPPGTLVRIQRACESPQALGVLLFGQSCSDFLQQAKAHTRSVAANLKPYTAETDFMSLQGYLSPLSH